jgi:DNA polymerase-3 subunit alpha
MILNCHSYYSLRYGTLSLRELIQSAVELGIETLVLTDINNSSAALDFIRLAQKHGIRPLVGVEFQNKEGWLFTLIAESNEGFYQINHYLSSFLLEGKDFEKQPPKLVDTLVLYPLGAKRILNLRSNEYLAVLPHQCNQLLRYNQTDLKKCVALHTITFQSKQKYYELHRILRAVDFNTTLPKLESHQVAPKNQFFVEQEQLEKKYKLYPQLVEQGHNLIKDLEIDFDYGVPKNKAIFGESEEADQALLLQISEEGFHYRYHNNPKARQRFEKEMKVILELGFTSYFLITWDIIQYAHSQGYHHIGRGSGANSIIAYCLKITDVDPIDLDLYFERFINPHRTSPPDFDIDFSWDERDDVIDYVFKKHGAKYVSLIATYNTFKTRSAIREIAKTFALPKEEIDRLIKYPEHILNANTITRKLLFYANLVNGFPNYLGIHAGGIIISEEPLFNYTAMQMMPKGFPIVHWDMYVAEEIGFHKYDVLSQRGLGHIKEAVQIIKKNQGIEVDIHEADKFKKDKKVRQQLQSGNTIGCFYIESPAMRGLLNKLKCDNYISLVAASSIIRPGVAKSGMMKQYIERFHNRDFKYLHPIMEKHLKETYGIMIYQEDVIKIAHYFADIDLADADILRRAMSGKFRSKAEMDRVVNLFFDNCKKKGFPDELTKEVWRQIESFSGYSFSKAHSASYAVESFQSLYLKAHFPLEFMVAVINNRGGFYGTEFYVNEARNAGAIIKEPCVNRSEINATIYGKEIFIGLSFVRELEHRVSKRIIWERKENGLFKNIQNFMDRIQPSLEQIMILIRINALRFSGLSKKELTWTCQFILKSTTMPASRLRSMTYPSNSFRNGSLFKPEVKNYHLPPLHHNPYDDYMDQIELIGYSIESPFNLVKSTLKKSLFAKDLIAHEDQVIYIAGYYVAQKKVKTVKHQLMKFGCFIDQKGQFFDTIHFPDTLAQYPLQGRGCYYIMGKVVLDFGYPNVEVIKVKKLEWKEREGFDVAI